MELSRNYLVFLKYLNLDPLCWQMCWLTDTYYLPEEVTRIPGEFERTNRICYYQWVPMMALVQAIMFYLPRTIWNILNKKSGIAVSTITDAAMERQQKADQAKADKIMEFMVRHVARFLKELSWDSWKEGRCWLMKHVYVAVCGSYLTCLYIVIKHLYIGNAIGQLFLMNAFLDTTYNMYGIDVIQRLTTHKNWTTSDRFPKTSICHYRLREFGDNSHRYTVQCALPMNLLNELFYTFLWFWLIFVATASTGSLLSWIILSFPRRSRYHYIKHQLCADGKIRRQMSEVDKKWLKDFVFKYLRKDGCLIVRMVERNTSDVVAVEMLSGLWENYVSKRRQYEDKMADISSPINPETFKYDLVDKGGPRNSL